MKITIFAAVETNRKYWKLAMKNAGVFGTLCFLVLWLFSSSINGMTVWIALGYGVIAFLCDTPVFYWAFRYHWTDENRFTFKWMLVPLLSFVILVIPSVLYSAFVYGYSPLDFFVQVDGGNHSSQFVFALKMILASILVVSVIQFLGASNEREIVINVQQRDIRQSALAPQEQKLVKIQGNAKHSSLELDIDRLLYVEADANYLNVVSFTDELTSATMRLTLKQFEEAVAEYPEVVRCHRAYLVNLNNVSYLEDLSSKGELHFNAFQGTVPVSKTYLEYVSVQLRNPIANRV